MQNSTTASATRVSIGLYGTVSTYLLISLASINRLFRSTQDSHLPDKVLTGHPNIPCTTSQGGALGPCYHSAASWGYCRRYMLDLNLLFVLRVRKL